jgi:ATP-dependent protease Clp ATPase subunit
VPDDDFLTICSFCGRPPDADRTLVVGPTVSICNVCVMLAAKLILTNERKIAARDKGEP